MFTYYQEHPKAKWAYVLDSDTALQQLKEMKVPMQSVLSVKEPIDDEDEKGKYGKSYKGPFYIDIDVDGEPAEAIASAQEFGDKLQAHDVNEYQVYLSGKKGFHFIIPMQAFAAARPVKSLPLVYKEMALELYVEGVDLAVYNEGRPRLLRTANVIRADNKKYKVPISQEELYNMTPEMYSKLTENPRPEIAIGEPKLSLKMQAVYEMAKSRMQKKQKSLSELEFVPDEAMVKTIGEDGKLPGCIQTLIEKGDTKSGATFNQAAIQFAAYMVKADVKDWVKYAKEMSVNVKSSSYNTEGARLTEIKKLVNYVGSGNQYGFSKAMLFSVMEPCRDCVICNGTVTDGEVTPGDYEFTSDISETPTGYITGFGKSQREITTFTLEIISKFSHIPEDEEEGETRVGTHAIIRVNGHKRERVTIMEEAWNSVRDFKQVTKGKGNLAFYGSDIDLQKLKHKLFADESNMTEIAYVHSVGIHRHKVAGRTILVYVEPGFSVSSTRERDTHQVWGSVPACPNIKEALYPDAEKDTDGIKEFIDKLLHCNDPLVTCTLVGWMALCHIKVQLTMRDNQFPIINLWGNAGSGKSAISSLFVYLHGVDYMLEHSPMSLQGTTPWAVAQYCTTSESTPRLIEEFNRGEMPSSKYDQFSGMFKAAWNKQTFAKGGIERHGTGAAQLTGAKVIESQISAPLCVMSEQAPERPALRQRMIQLNVRKSGRELPQAEENFYHVIDNKDRMTSLARAMVWESLDTHPEWVADTMESFRELVPREIDARPRFSYQAVLTGIEFFGKTLKSIGLDEDYIKETISFMRSTVVDNLIDTLDEVRIEKSRTEVSLVITEMAIMADSYKNQIQWSIGNDEHYIKTKDYLYLDTAICHVTYTRWARSGSSKVIISSLQQFEALIEQEDFFVETCTHGGIADGQRKLVKLDCKRMLERGIDVSMFVESMYE